MITGELCPTKCMLSCCSTHSSSSSSSSSSFGSFTASYSPSGSSGSMASGSTLSKTTRSASVLKKELIILVSKMSLLEKEDLQSPQRKLWIGKLKEYNRRPVTGSKKWLVKKLERDLLNCQKDNDVSFRPIKYCWAKADPAQCRALIFHKTVAGMAGVAQMLGERPEQQDQYAIDEIIISKKTFRKVLHVGIYDGHCGSRCASFLSRRASKYFEDAFQKEKVLNPKVIINILKVAYVHLGEQYREEIRKMNKQPRSVDNPQPEIPQGSTAASIFIGFKRLWVVNVGDSRVVFFPRKGKPIALTNDDKIHKKKVSGEISMRGGIIKDLGDNNLVAEFVTYGIQRKIAVPSVGHSPVSGFHARGGITGIPLSRLPEGDHFIVSATDGVWDVVSTNALSDYMRELIEESEKQTVPLTEEAIAEKIAKRCYMSDPKGADNITVIVTPLKIRH